MDGSESGYTEGWSDLIYDNFIFIYILLWTWSHLWGPAMLNQVKLLHLKHCVALLCLYYNLQHHFCWDSIKRKGGTSKLQQCGLWYSVAFMVLLCLAATGFCTLLPFISQHPLCVPLYCWIFGSVIMLLMLFMSCSFNWWRLYVREKSFWCVYMSLSSLFLDAFL